MSRYIDENALTEIIQRMWENRKITNTKYNTFLEILDYVPTADVRENVHGEWIDEEIECGGIYGGVATQIITRCSNCDECWEYKTNFCPNCGAKMTRGAEE